MPVFENPFKNIALERLPKVKNSSLLPWDSADLLILESIRTQNIAPAQLYSLAIINDSFGALACVLHDYSPDSIGDSVVSHRALHDNLLLNQLTPSIAMVPSSQGVCGTQSISPYKVVLMKVPKQLSLLEFQLAAIRPMLAENCRFIAAAKTKNIHNSTLKLFEKYIGPCKTSLAKKKSRLIYAEVDKNITPPAGLMPSSYFSDSLGIDVEGFANVFSRERLDRGAQFLIEQFSQLPQAESILDLGCGNGILGLHACLRYPQSIVNFIDESYLAISSAKKNHQTLKTLSHDAAHALFHASDGIPDSLIKKQSADLILCNPPFHQGHVISDHTAWRLLQQSHQALKTTGELWIVGNRHLNYAAKLKALFGNSDVIASNPRFTITRAKKHQSK